MSVRERNCCPHTSRWAYRVGPSTLEHEHALQQYARRFAAPCRGEKQCMHDWHLGTSVTRVDAISYARMQNEIERKIDVVRASSSFIASAKPFKHRHCFRPRGARSKGSWGPELPSAVVRCRCDHSTPWSNIHSHDLFIMAGERLDRREVAQVPDLDAAIIR